MLNFKLRKEPKQELNSRKTRSKNVEVVSLRVRKDSSSESVKKVLADSNQKLILMVRE